MKGFGFETHGGVDRLKFVDIAPPSPGADEVQIRLRASSFNRLDRFTLAGIPGVPIELPHVLGSDGAGTVEQIGSGVVDIDVGSPVLLNPGFWDGTCEACRRGDEALCRNYRILGEHTQGTATKLVVVPRRNAYPIPSGLSFAQAAAVPLVFQTVWRALRTVGGVMPGDRVAIIGAGGATATAAVQVAKLLGAQVAVASRSAEKAIRTKGLGADVSLVFDEGHPLDRILWEWSGKRGVDVVFDSVGTPTLAKSVRALARGGRAVVIGATAGPMVELDVRTLFWRNASVRGSTMANRKEFEEVLLQIAKGALRPVIDSEYPLERAAEAFRRIDAPDLFGKVVLSHSGA